MGGNQVYDLVQRHRRQDPARRARRRRRLRSRDDAHPSPGPCPRPQHRRTCPSPKALHPTRSSVTTSRWRHPPSGRSASTRRRTSTRWPRPRSGIATARRSTSTAGGSRRCGREASAVAAGNPGCVDPARHVGRRDRDRVRLEPSDRVAVPEADDGQPERRPGRCGRDVLGGCRRPRRCGRPTVGCSRGRAPAPPITGTRRTAGPSTSRRRCDSPGGGRSPAPAWASTTAR